MEESREEIAIEFSGAGVSIRKKNFFRGILNCELDQ